MAERQLFYYDPSIVDLDKLRDECQRTIKGDSRTPPEAATIHFHRMADSCAGKQHERYIPGDDT